MTSLRVSTAALLFSIGSAVLVSPNGLAEVRTGQGDATVRPGKSGSDDDPRVEFDAVLMLDGSVFDGVYGDGESRHETQIRRLNFGLSAEMSEALELELSAKYDEDADELEVRDAKLQWTFSPRQSITLGKQKEAIGLEHNQSSSQIPAMERSMASALFTPDRNIGVSYANVIAGQTLALGVYEADHDSDVADLAISGRVTAALMHDKAQTLHIGGSFSHRDLGGTSMKLKDEGGVNPASNVVDSSRFDVETQRTGGVEMAWLRGSLLMQGEWFRSGLTLSAREEAGKPEYTAAYLQGSWLFGEARRKYKNGKFKLSGLKGSTAWELVLRAEQADLRDDAGGSQTEVLMIGVNHYRGKHLRFMANVLTADTREDNEDKLSGNAANLRVQYVF